MREVPNFGVIRPETVVRIIDNIFSCLEDGDHLTIAFQGGEPTVAGLECLEQFIDCVSSQTKRVKVNYALQTNGINIDDAWCAFLKKNSFLVGLSLDGPDDFHNTNRVTPDGNGTHSTVIEAKRRLDSYGIEYNILCVLTEEIAHHPRLIFEFLLENQIRYVQFIPCLDGLKCCGSSQALTPRSFHSFYTELYRLWHEELKTGTYISVKLFDDVLNLFLYSCPTACGIVGNCSMQFVTEADGSVYPCDFYVLDKFKLGNLQTDSLSALYDKYLQSGFASDRGDIPTICTQCKYLKFCRGGCKRMENTMYIDDDFCGYRAFLDDVLISLCNDAKMLRR